MKQKLLSLALVAVLLLAAGCAGGGGDSAAGDTPGSEAADGDGSAAAPSGGDGALKIGLDVDPETMDPRLSRDVSGLRIFELAFDGLITLNEFLEPIPNLAETWENPDELTWIFHLRQGVTFHDGSDLTAEDVKYTYDTIRDPDFGSPLTANYSAIEEVVVVDDYTVQFNLNAPYSPLLSNNCELSIVPAEAESIVEFDVVPVGSGPYILREWTKNNRIVLEANPDYWNGVSDIPRIEFYIIPENSTRVAALEAGDVDLVYTPLTPQDIERIRGDSRFVVAEMSGLGLHNAVFNHGADILSDKEVRTGLSYFIDKETMAYELSQGMEKPADSFLIPGTWYYSENVKGIPYDPAKGLEVLQAAGWEDSDGDGVLDKDGQKLSVTICTYTEDYTKMQMAEYMQNTFTMNGVDATVDTREWLSFIADVQAGNFDIAIFGMLNMFDPDKFAYNYLRSGGDSQWGSFSSKEFDDLIVQARTVSDQAERVKLYEQAAQINVDEVMYNCLVYQGYVALYNANLHGFVPQGRGSLRSLKDASFGG